MYKRQDPWHPLCSFYVLDYPLGQPLSRFSLLFLLVLDPLLHTPCISLPSHYLLFAAHAHTNAACSAVILMLCHLYLLSLSLSSLLGSLSFSLTPHIHLTILISARWSATTFSFLTYLHFLTITAFRLCRFCLWLQRSCVSESPAENWRRPPGRPHTSWMKNIHDDLSSLDPGIHEARDLAQNRPLWTHDVFAQRYTLVVVHAAIGPTAASCFRVSTKLSVEAFLTRLLFGFD